MYDLCGLDLNLLGSSAYLRPGSSVEQRFLINTHHMLKCT